MKIAVFDNVPPGGAARVVSEQVLYLAEHGHEVVWFTTSHQKNALLPTSVVRINHNLSDQINRQSIPFRAFWLCNQLKREYKKLYENITAHNPDLILVHPCKHTQAPYLLSISKIPTIYFIEEPLRVTSEPELHSLSHLRILSRWAAICERKILKRIDRYNTRAATYRLTHSNFCARAIEQYYQLSAKPIGLGVDPSIFKKSSTTNYRVPYFLFVGEKNEINGYTFLQKAIIHRHIKIIYVSAKDGAFAISDKQLVKLYSQATATLCLARREPFGLVALESMACSTPVIALSEGGYKETVDAGKTGILIKRHPKSLSAAIDRMLETTFQKYLSNQCRPYVTKHFSWHLHGKRLDEFLMHVSKQLA